MLDAFAFAAAGECEVETDLERGLPRLPLPPDDRPSGARDGARAGAAFEPSYALSGGGADANVFNGRGLASA